MKDKVENILKDKGKSLFLFLGWASLGVYWVIGLIFSYFFIHSQTPIPDWISFTFLTIFFGFLIILMGGLSVIHFSVATGIDLLYPHRKKQITLTALSPMIYLLGSLIKIKKNKIRLSYIVLSNALWMVQAKRLDGSRVLILLPHCIQLFDCPYKITHKIQNCRKCGKCVISEIVTLADKYNVFIAVATGGTLARKIIVDYKPSFIIAVACERDLSIGVWEVYPIPVFGVLNERPYGPCINTTVDIKKLEKAIQLVKHLN